MRAMLERSLGRDALPTWREWGLDLDAFCACMLSYEPGERDAAEALFDLLLNLKTVSAALSNALNRLGRGGRAWGSTALRLPDWDRDAWAVACAELLGASDVGRSERRLAALQFRHLRTPGEAVLQRLTLLSGSADDEISSAASLALRQL